MFLYHIVTTYKLLLFFYVFMLIVLVHFMLTCFGNVVLYAVMPVKPFLNFYFNFNLRERERERGRDREKALKWGRANRQPKGLLVQDDTQEEAQHCQSDPPLYTHTHTHTLTHQHTLTHS